MKKFIHICLSAIFILAYGFAQADTIYVVPVGTPTTLNYMSNLAMFGVVGALIESATNSESSRTSADTINSATHQVGPQVYLLLNSHSSLSRAGAVLHFQNRWSAKQQNTPPGWIPKH